MAKWPLITPVFKILDKCDFGPEKSVCILSFDEVIIKKQYVYDKVRDETLKPANYVQMAIIRGLFEKLKQPIFF